jgi:hypothetical protein
VTPDELDAIEAEIVEGDESVDDLAAIIATLRAAWAEAERLSSHIEALHEWSTIEAERDEARAEVERLRRGEVDGVFTSVVHECCERVARVRALCDEWNGASTWGAWLPPDAADQVLAALDGGDDGE